VGEGVLPQKGRGSRYKQKQLHFWFKMAVIATVTEKKTFFEVAPYIQIDLSRQTVSCCKISCF